MEISVTARYEYELKLKNLDIKCSSLVSVPEGWRGRNNGRNNECGCFAKVVIDGVPYCIKHARIVALNKLIAEKLAVNL